MESIDFIIEQLLDQWENRINETTKVFQTIGVKNASQEVARGKNTVIYLLGHLITVHDRLFEAFDCNDRFYPEYDELFLTPQDIDIQYPDYDLLLQQWIATNERLSPQLRKFTISDWQSKHHYVNESDFILNPKRNKLNVFLSRNAHLSYHAGQLALVQQAK